MVSADGSNGTLRENSVVWVHNTDATGNHPAEYYVLETFVALTGIITQKATQYIWQGVPIVYTRMFVNNEWSEWGSPAKKPQNIGGIASSYPYTCTVDGFAVVSIKAWHTQTLPLDGSVFLNGEAIGGDYFTFTYQTLCVTIPVKVGDVITCTDGFNFSLRIIY